MEMVHRDFLMIFPKMLKFMVLKIGHQDILKIRKNSFFIITKGPFYDINDSVVKPRKS